MATRTKRALLSILLVFFMFASLMGTAMAENGVTVDPEENIFTLAYGETDAEVVTVTIPAGTSVSKADIYFLADTTGSMGSPIASVKAGANDIIDEVIAEFPEVDIQFGVGDFKDFPYDPYCFKHAVSITDNTDAVKTAINAWFASGGYDTPEGQFFAYDQLAEDNDPDNGTIGWREGSKKILVVFGDAPSHDPIPPCVSGLDYTITEASVTQKLVDAGITFIGISTTTGLTAAMDADPKPYAYDYNSPCPGYVSEGEAGQATRIAEATGGVHLLNVSSAQIVSEIKGQITTAVTTINNLSLVPAGDIAPFVQGIDPDSYGPLDAEDSHALDFAVDWEGVVEATDADQVFTGFLNVVADGSVIGFKPVQITVPATVMPGEAAISIEKTVDFNGDGIYSDAETNYAGEPAHWKIVVTNTGEAPVYGIEVTDDNGQVFGPFDLLEKDDYETFYYTTYPVAGFVNEACAAGVDGEGAAVGPVCDTASVTAMTPPDPEVDCETRLIAGQHIDVGSVGITRGDGTLCVTYSLDEWALAEGWLINEIHLAVANELSAIPQTGGRNPNPIPGRFPYKAYFDPGVGEYTICIDLNEADFDVEETLYIAAHAALSNGESAWGQGERFNERGNWGMYFTCGDEEDGNLTEGSTGTGDLPSGDMPGAAPEGSMGMPAKHKVDGPTFGQSVSELARSAPNAVAEHVLSKMKR